NNPYGIELIGVCDERGQKVFIHKDLNHQPPKIINSLLTTFHFPSWYNSHTYAVPHKWLLINFDICLQIAEKISYFMRQAAITWSASQNDEKNDR
ncbi:MAG TPA: hypothetical protein VF896_02660, partial [Anaerolineales bacterium]